MDKKLEGTLQRALDKLLQGTLERTYYRLLKDGFLNHVKEKKDFLFGVIVGDMLEGLGLCTFGAHKRYPSDSEFKETLRIILGREEEILRKVEVILSQ